MNRKSGTLRRVAVRIMEYFLRNPKAADDLYGIASYRLPEQVIYQHVTEVSEALDWLVSVGWLNKMTSASSSRSSASTPRRGVSGKFVTSRSAAKTGRPWAKDHPTRTCHECLHRRHARGIRVVAVSNLARVLAPEFASLSSAEIRALMEYQYGEGAAEHYEEYFEGIFGDIGKAFSSAAKDVGKFAQKAAPVVADIGGGALKGALAGAALGPVGIIGGAALGGAGAGLSKYGKGAAGQVGGVLSGVTNLAGQFTPLGRVGSAAGGIVSGLAGKGGLKNAAGAALGAVGSALGGGAGSQALARWAASSAVAAVEKVGWCACRLLGGGKGARVLARSRVFLRRQCDDAAPQPAPAARDDAGDRRDESRRGRTPLHPCRIGADAGAGERDHEPDRTARQPGGGRAAVLGDGAEAQCNT